MLDNPNFVFMTVEGGATHKFFSLSTNPYHQVNYSKSVIDVNVSFMIYVKVQSQISSINWYIFILSKFLGECKVIHIPELWVLMLKE